jgi:predicted MPP superfamily phosphohydrolase
MLALDPADLLSLSERMGQDVVRRRLALEHDHRTLWLHQGEGVFRLERWVDVDTLVRFCLKISGLAKRGYRNFLDIQCVERHWWFARLPPAFDGFRLLQMSDPHADLDEAWADIAIKAIQRTPHDAAVITGDFRNATYLGSPAAVEVMRPILAAMTPPLFGILGNHDFIELVPPLEKMGLRLLLNEVVSLEREGARLWIGGVDDPHFYRTHDLAKVRAAIPEDGFALLLAHSPEVWREAARLKYDFMLAGHTHGGQICLPGGRAVVCPCHVPEAQIYGPWAEGTLQGFTSPGTGSCGVAARFNRPPELTLHILHRKG